MGSEMCIRDRIYVCDKNWPDFDEDELDKVLKEYENRNRTFGRV